MEIFAQIIRLGPSAWNLGLEEVRSLDRGNHPETWEPSGGAGWAAWLAWLAPTPGAHPACRKPDEIQA